MSVPMSLCRRGFGRAALLLVTDALLAARAGAQARLPPPLSPTMRAIAASGRLRVAMCPGFVPLVAAGADADAVLALCATDPPTVQRASDGQKVVGLDVDLAAAAAHSLGARLSIELVEPLERVFDLLHKGEVECGLGGVTRTLQRAAALAFSSPYLMSGLEIFVKDGARFATLKQVAAAGVRVGVLTGSPAESLAHKLLKPAHLLSFTEPDRMFAAFTGDGRSAPLDAVLTDGLLGRDAALRKRAPATLVSVENRRITAEAMAIVTRQGDADWTSYLSLLLHELRLSGAFQRMAQRYNLWLRVQR